MKAFHKAQLKILRTSSQVEKRIENNKKTENAALHLVLLLLRQMLNFPRFYPCGSKHLQTLTNKVHCYVFWLSDSDSYVDWRMNAYVAYWYGCEQVVQ